MGQSRYLRHQNGPPRYATGPKLLQDGVGFSQGEPYHG
jgi:hypothetical protein